MHSAAHLKVSSILGSSESKANALGALPLEGHRVSSKKPFKGLRHSPWSCWEERKIIVIPVDFTRPCGVNVVNVG